MKGDKEYIADIRFGAVSETDDATGKLTQVPYPETLSKRGVELALQRFIGHISQRPPAYSAIKVDGKRSYKIARATEGISEPLAPKKVELISIEILDFHSSSHNVLVYKKRAPVVKVRIVCASGFYVRSLARDLGEMLGTGAYLETLKRTRVGPLKIENAVSLEQAIAAGTNVSKLFLPNTVVLGGLRLLRIDQKGRGELSHGRGVLAPGFIDGEICAVDENGKVLAMGNIKQGRFQPHKLIELD